jgi:hypothetical protein
MKSVLLTGKAGQPVYVNPDAVTLFRPSVDDPRYVEVRFSDGQSQVIKESMTETATKLALFDSL